MDRDPVLKILLPAFLAVAWMAGTPAAATPTAWDVRGVGAEATQIKSISDAQNLLTGQYPTRSDETGQYSTINFNQLATPAGGKFANDVNFPGTTPGNEQNIAVEATGYINIMTPGAYTFGVSSDDGFALKIGDSTMTFPGLRSHAESYSTFVFNAAGAYPADLVYFNHSQRGELELFATPGTYTTIGQPGSNFQLVGDGANGGLQLADSSVPVVGAALPEPQGLLLVAPLSLLLLRRRRQA